MIRFVLRRLGDFKLKFFLVVLCAVMQAATDLLMPYLSAKFIDEILGSREVGQLYFFVGGLLALNGVSLAANWFYVIFSTKMRARITNRLVEDLTLKIWRTDSRRLLKTDMIYLAKRVERDSDDLTAFVLGSAIDISIQGALLCLAIFFLWMVGVKWLIIFAAVAAFHMAIYFALKGKLFALSTAVRESESKYFANLSDNFFFVYRIKLHSLQEKFLTAFQSAFEKFFSVGVREAKVRFWFSYGNANSAKIFTVLIFLLGGLDVLSGAMTVGNFVALNGYFSFAMQSVSFFMTLGQGYQNACAAFRRIEEIFSAPPDIHGKKILERITEIKLCDLTYEVDGRKILEKFSAKFERGKIYCVVGANGAGKSTLLNLLCGILPATNGEIFFDGARLSEVDMIHARKNLFAAVEQKDFFKNDTASGGERRKVSITTAFEKSADVLIMDEPDNNLDAAAVDMLIEKILRGKSNRITLIISHDERLILLADEILSL